MDNSTTPSSESRFSGTEYSKAVQASALSGPARAALMSMLTFSNNSTGELWAGTASIAKRANMARSTLMAALPEVDGWWVDTGRRAGRTGKVLVRKLTVPKLSETVRNCPKLSEKLS